VHHVTTVAVQNAGQEVERAGDIQIRYIHMPMTVGMVGLLEPFPFATGFGLKPIQHARTLQDPIVTLTALTATTSASSIM
jgi:hypothetical protein